MEVLGLKGNVDVQQHPVENPWPARRPFILKMGLLSLTETDSIRYVCWITFYNLIPFTEFNIIVTDIINRLISLQMCEPAKKLKRCKYFRDVTWTYVTYPDQKNSTQQLMHCRCPKNSVAYLIKRHAFQTPKGTGYQYSFACSPQTVS